MGDALNVLVVDGGSGLLAQVREALLGRKDTIGHASSAMAAIQLTMDTSFDAALIELELPEESGLAVVQHVRATQLTTPVLVWMRGQDPKQRIEVLASGADDVFGAELSVEEVLARLDVRVAAARRVAKLLEERDELKALSTTDGLTGLANQRAFKARLEEEFRRASRYDDPMALILMDVDHFKSINDSHGHLIGDEVLVSIAKAIKGAVRETDFLARYGGEEFGVLLPKTHLAGALTVADRMTQALRAIRAGKDGSLRVTASFGVSGFPGRGVTTPEQLLRTADDALYRSKREGRNKISLFQSSLFVAKDASNG